VTRTRASRALTRRLALGLALALVGLAGPRAAEACAPAPPPGVRVQVADEEAIIAWDADAHREEFVRRAVFRGAGVDFGFLVPTPSKPELGEVPDEVFERLDAATRPDIVERTETGLSPVLVCAFPFWLMRGASKSAVPASAPVRVLDTRRVAGFDAVVLEADDARALAAWLDQHGYAQRPELAAWLAPYVAARWKLTAFKVAADAGSKSAATSAVRMSFATDRPFFPYREPTDQRENLPASEVHATRLLRVFFLGGARVDGAIGERRDPWPGRTLWSDRLDPARLGALPFPLPAGAWLTVFEDAASPRPGTDDLFFAAAADARPIRPPPIVRVHEEEIPVPVDVLAALALGVWWIAKRRRTAAARR
jgi:hypothetical protein